MKKSKSMCSGCENDFYNGNNNLNVKKCWSFEDAEIQDRKRVLMSHVPPWKQKPTKMLSCYHEKGYVFVEGDREY